MLKTIDINGNPYIGIFCRANDNFGIVPYEVDSKTIKIIEDVLDINVIKTTIYGTSLVGVFTAMNSYGLILPEYVSEKEIDILKRYINVGIISDKLNAVGNNIVVNDRTAFVNPSLNNKTIETIEDVLSVEVVKGIIAGMKIVGAVCVATNKGLLCHPKTAEDEIKILKEIFSLPVNICTVNYGSYLLGAGIIANSKGAVVGNNSTGIEIGRVEEGLCLF